MSCGNENPEMYRGQFERGSSYCTPNGVFLLKKNGFGRWEWQAGTSCECETCDKQRRSLLPGKDGGDGI